MKYAIMILLFGLVFLTGCTSDELIPINNYITNNNNETTIINNTYLFTNNINVTNGTATNLNLTNVTIYNGIMIDVSIPNVSITSGRMNGTMSGNCTACRINMSQAMNTLPVLNGGTGTTTSTGSGSVVLGTSPAIITATITNPNISFTVGNRTFTFSQNTSNSTFNTACAGNVTMTTGLAVVNTTCARPNGFMVFITRTTLGTTGSGNYTIQKGNQNFNITSSYNTETSRFDWLIIWT